ncbi:MBL fold metallo-hydrolase [Bradyrhizobium sp. LMTR 3]|uniref:MBL fold metallo-hydrolase n=1 Tax=Bradyrhizobium sp. LMTR 3 TaxID=189873 RepID=UPI001AECF8DB|nr:MBL fold metallo-hydrolase [Bradyrhizobium sp. LMTR 3]
MRHTGDIAVTFVNHATFLIQCAGLNILSDPIWSLRASPVGWFGPKRVREPGLALDDLPPIDVILISHNHYDHLDIGTLRRLHAKFSPVVLVAAGDRDLVRSVGFTHVHEFDWWEDFEIGPGCKVTFAPTQHFSARGIRDRQRSLWGSYLIQDGDRRVYFGGDSGYSHPLLGHQEKTGVSRHRAVGDRFLRAAVVHDADAYESRRSRPGAPGSWREPKHRDASRDVSDVLRSDRSTAVGPGNRHKGDRLRRGRIHHASGG